MLFQDLAQAPQTPDFDVAVYGAGPAGISLAIGLAQEGKRVGLFEAGGLERPVADADHPYAGDSVGRPYDVLSTRLRYFGGTTNHWGGWVRPLDPYDFEPRPFQSLSGWPLTRAELDRYYEGAMWLCEVPGPGLGAGVFDHDFGYRGYLHEKDDRLTFKNFLFSPPTFFGQRYLQAVEESENIECYLNTTLTQLLAEGDSIGEAELADTGGNTRTVRAQRHVLAMGGIENARMLLHSGLGNSSDFVGRCFSDHLGTTTAFALAEDVNRYEVQEVDFQGQKFNVMPHLAMSSEFMLEERLTNFGMAFLPTGQEFTSVETGIRYELSDRTAGGMQHYGLLVRMETTPNPHSRITLSDKRDKFGIPRVVLDWQVNRSDFENVERIGRLLLPMLSIAGSRMKPADLHLRDEIPQGTMQSHHMGTTRMSENPEQGVVDADLRCHDLKNLYITGSSVFPTFGFANPTLTLLALTLRLRDHLLGLDP